MSKIKVAITIDELDMGGAQHVVHGIVGFIDLSKFDIYILCTDGKREHSLLEQEMLNDSVGKYTIIFLKDRRFSGAKTKSVIVNKGINKIRRITNDIKAIIELHRLLQKIKPDIIHAHQHGIWAAYWSIPRGVQLIITVHTSPSVTFSRESERYIFRRYLQSKNKFIVAISKSNLDLVRPFWNLSDYNSCYINNGIDIKKYQSKEHKVFTFINASRQDENKNQKLILKAFALLYNENTDIKMNLFLIGDGECHNNLKELAIKLGIQDLVIFTGYVSCISDYLANSDVYVSSSHREGLSLSVLEAMASKLPVIATNAGGVHEIVRENGFLISDNNTDELYNAMKTLRDNKAMCLNKGEYSYKMVMNYSVQKMASGYADLYESIVKKNNFMQNKK